MIYQFPTQSNNSRVCRVDVAGAEISVRKRLEYKEFSKMRRDFSRIKLTKILVKSMRGNISIRSVELTE